MVKSVRPTIRDDRGAILIHMALSILVLTGMLAFVLDHGMMWTARRQAQNAADAGALAAGEALIYDNYTRSHLRRPRAFERRRRRASQPGDHAKCHGRRRSKPDRRSVESARAPDVHRRAGQLRASVRLSRWYQHQHAAADVFRARLRPNEPESPRDRDRTAARRKATIA